MDLISTRDFVASPYRSEREKVISISRWNVRQFFKLLDRIKIFLEYDKCYRLADNYLIAMVFAYFLRAKLGADEYTRQNFFAALYLAYNMEEDDGEINLMEIALFSRCDYCELKERRYRLFERMRYRGAVSKYCCELVMRNVKPEDPVWQRRRHESHSGVVDMKLYGPDGRESKCPVCKNRMDFDDYELPLMIEETEDTNERD